MTPREAAEEMGISVEQLSFYFKMYEKMEFRCWRKHLRIEKAKTIILNNPHLSMSAVGEYVGIPDRGNFRREFYEVCNEWPSKWKEANVNQSK
ncbi:MAG: helix-turn-helix domain-containing protein [Bacteroidales bacterium]|nr:helix-turn-helix domain-containing protein [Bacteroidales bacterium]